jgi:phosphatidylglycerophosphatase A
VFISQDLTKGWGKDPRQIPLVVTFLFFRFFDITKPPPLRKLEAIQGGWGIMLDDFGAAIYTTVVILLITQFFTV